MNNTAPCIPDRLKKSLHYQSKQRVPECFRHTVLLAGLLLPLLGVGKFPPKTISEEASYAELPGHKAMTLHSTDTTIPYVAHSQPNKLAAATAAQQACRSAHPVQSLRSYCEIVRLDDIAVTSAADIRSLVPEQPHPLYLWHFQRGESTVFLAGSVHILKSGLYPLPAQYQQAFELSSSLVLEVNLDALSPEQLQSKTMQYAIAPAQEKLSDVLPSELYARLQTAARRYGLPLPQMEHFKASFIAQQLTLLAMMSLGYDPNEGMEKHFIRQASDREILELETLDFQLQLLMNQSLETQHSMVTDTLAQLPGLEALTTDLITAWLSGDDQSFAHAFQIQSGASRASTEFMHQLIDKRNMRMADKIEGLLHTRGSYFVLIGSGHYVGDNSIVTLLEKRGVTGRRVFSNESLNP